MAGVYDYARALAKAIRETEEFKNMKRLGAKVKGSSKAEDVLSEFRLRQLELQAFQVQGKEPPKEQIERVQKLVRAVEADSLLKDYLAAETAYGQVLVEVQNVLAEVYNPEVPGAIRKR